MNKRNQTDTKINNKKRKLSLKAIVLIAVTIFMVGIVLINLGRPILKPWPLSLEFNCPNEISVDNLEISISTDQNSGRLIILDKESKIEQCVEIDPYNNNGKQFSSVLAQENTLYYSVAYSDPATTYLTNEKVVKRNRDGSNEQVIYSREYNDDEHFLKPTFITIAKTSDDISLLCSSKDKKHLEVISLENDQGNIKHSIQFPEHIGPIASASYSKQLNNCAVVSTSGKLYVSRNLAPFEYVPIDNSPVLNDCAWSYDGNLYSVSPFLGTLIKVDNTNKTSYSYTTEKKYNSVCEQNDGHKLLCGTIDGADLFDVDEINKVPLGENSLTPLVSFSGSWDYSLSLCIRTLSFWFAVLYLLVLFFVLIIKAVKTQIKKKNYNTLGKTCIVVVGLVALVGLSVFYSTQIYDISLRERQATINSLCSNNVKLYHDGLAYNDNITDKSSDSYQQKMLYVADAVSNSQKSTCQSFADYGLSIQIDAVIWTDSASLFATTDADGATYKRFYAEDAQQLITKYDELRNRLVESSNDITNAGFNMDILDYLYPDKILSCQVLDTYYSNIKGVLIISSSVADLGKMTNSLINEISISLIITFGFLILIFLEGKALIDVLLSKRKKVKSNTDDKEIKYTRQFNFLMAMATGFDCTICILVSKDILAANNLPTNDALVSFPTMASSLGVFIGIILFGVLSKKIAGKKIYILGCVISAIFTLCAFFAVINNAFWPYVACKFLACVSIYIPSAMVNVMPYLANSEEDKAKYLQDLAMTGISGVAIGNVICGYCAESLGNASIYLANIVPIILAIIMGLKNIPRNKIYYKDSANSSSLSSSKKSNKKNIIKMFLSPSLISLALFIILPLSIASGYKSILFPLYAADEGMSKTLINNIVVITNILVFIVSPSLTKLFDRFDKKNSIILVHLLVSVVFCWFFINDTTIWAVIVLFLIGCLSKLSVPGQQILVSRAALYYDVEQTEAGNIDSLEANFVGVIRSPILTSFTNFGMQMACVIVGAITGVGAILFAFVTRNNDKSPFGVKNIEPESQSTNTQTD